MFDIKKYFTNGLRNSILLRNNSTFSVNGPWKQVYNNSLVTRWHHGEFSSAEFTISVDFDTENKEILKCLVCNGVSRSQLSVYGRNNLGNKLVNLQLQSNDSYVDLIISPTSVTYEGAKFIYNGWYYYNQNPLINP